MAPRRDAFEAQHARNRLVYEKRIKQIFTKVCYECGMSVTQLAGIVEQAGKDADFAQIPAVRKVMDKLQRRLAKDLQTTVIDGIRAEWKLANDKYDALIGTMVAGDLMERWDEQTRLRTMSRNLEALDAFIARKEGGLNLSQRVWQYSGQMRDAMEATLQLGISEGESAAEIARDLKQYLNYPDKLFRRVRDAETGELKLSKPASLFHPGQGVYRSSYKNALRLALNETNIAYRKADSVRRVGLYFVVGIEVHLSNNHNSKGVPEGEFYDICDILKGKYPPDFEFVGWHTQCYSDDSEVLTGRGWLPFKDVRPDDAILSLNPETRKAEWTGIVAQQCYQHDGPMVRFSNRSLDCLVTPEHQMVYLNKSDGRIKYCEAAHFGMGKGAFYRGCEYDAEDVKDITIAGRTYDFDTFCTFMGFWLADGACVGTSGITIAQDDGQASKDIIIDTVRMMGYNPTIYSGSVRFYNTAFVRWLRQFGRCNEKYIPEEIKNASKRQIRKFLDAYIICDGSIKQPHDFVGNRGAYFHSNELARSYLTTSRLMAGDLSELLLKIGARPSVYEREPSVAVKKDGSVIRGRYVCYVINELKAATATVFDRDIIDYNGFVYDLTLAKNHIMYIKRNGRCFWGSNCRCWTSVILNTDEEFFRDSDGKYRGSVNEVKDVPPQFKKWVEENKERIAKAEERGKLPYFLRDNRWAWDKEADRPNEKVEYRNTALDAAEARHAERTDAQVKAIKDRWAMRSEAMRNFARVERLINSVPGMREYLRAEVPASMNYLEGETPFDGNYTKLNKLVMVAKNQMRHLRSELDVLDRPWEALKEHGVEKILEASQSIRKKIAQWEGQPLDYQLKKLNFEADWVEKNKKGVISTWEVAKNAYLKAAAKVEWRMIWGKYEDEIKDLALNPHADPDMIAEARSYLGKDEAAVQMAIDNIKTDIELSELREEYDSYINEAPGAFNENARREIEAAFDNNEISEVRHWMSAAKAIITMYRDNKDKILDLIAQVSAPAVVQKLNEALANQGLTEMGNAIDLAERAIKFDALATQARIMLGDHRDLLLKLKPQVVTWLEERSVPKDYEAEDIVKLKSAIDSAQFWLDEWQKRKDKYAELWQYFINENIKSKEYKDLVMELRQAILDVDLAKADELIPKVEAQKDKHAAEKAYREGIKAEWEKMMADVQKVSDALNKDTDLLARATAAGLTLAVFNFMANADGPKKIREGRKTYKEILDLAEKLGISLSQNQITFNDSEFTQVKKDAAPWHKTAEEGNNYFHNSAVKVWNEADDKQKEALYNYTAGSSYITEPLRAIPGHYYAYSKKDKTNRDILAMTEILMTQKFREAVWIKRETGAWNVDYIFGINLSDYKNNPSALVGLEGLECSFQSCASCKAARFKDEGVTFTIYCPAGTMGVYAEPYSKFGPYGLGWDGSKKAHPGDSDENEVILQRGARMRITKAEYIDTDANQGEYFENYHGEHWFIDLEVIGFDIRDFEIKDGRGGYYCEFK